MNSRLLILPVAGLLLVGAAGAALATSGGSGATDIPLAAAPTASPGTTTEKTHPGDAILEDVLADLVTKGTITQAQSDAILKAVDDERTALQAEREAQHQLWETILADGKITQDELNQLPADSPLRNLDNLMDDGVITLDELRGLGGFGFGGRGGHGGHGPMGGWDDDGTAPGASPSASPSTSG